MTHKQLMTDEEFSALLVLPGAAHGNITRQEKQLTVVRDAVDAFRAESLQWAERRSAGQPSLAAAARQGERWAAMPQWSLALVAVVTIVGGVVHISRTAVQPATMSAASTASIAPSAGANDLAADNHLLSSIDAELSYHSASSVDSLQLQSSYTRQAVAADPRESE